MHEPPPTRPTPEQASQAFFADPQQALGSQLALARHSIQACVAGPCSRAWFELMLTGLRRGLRVSLSVQAVAGNLNASLSWERLTALGGRLAWLAPDSVALHTSVCVLDSQAVISGNFAQASSLSGLDFSGVLVQHSPDLAARCEAAMAGLPTLAHDPLSPDRPGQPAQNPVAALASTAHPAGGQLVAQTNPAQGVALWQVQLLEHQVLALEADTAEMQRKMQAFDQQQDHAIGQLLRQLLDTKQRCLAQRHAQLGGQHRQQEAQAAQAAFEEFEHSHQAMQQSPAAPLDEQEQADIKQLYRKLAMLCHPDRVEDGDKSQAQTIFQQLQLGYRNSNLQALKKLEAALQTQALSGPADHTPAAGPDWRLAKMQDRMAAGLLARASIVRSPTWRTLSTQSNWALWFVQQSTYLEDEIARYQQELQAMAAQTPA